jgi:osmotically-inducible protein OsmY
MLFAELKLATDPSMASDDKLATQISTQLAETNRANLRRLSVDVEAGQVTVRGSVASFYEKQIAIQTCRLLAGIERLIVAVDVSPAC